MNITDFKIYTKRELKQLSKSQICELFLQQQEILLELLMAQKKMSDRLNDVEEKINEPKKDSKNSSISSSHDMKRQTETNGKTKKKGAKPGHKGYGRKLKLKADEEIKCLIKKNPRTGKNIDSQSKSFQVHQIIDIEPMKIKVINILRQVTTGEDGKTVIAPNPYGIKAHQRFGNYFKTLVTALRYRYFMSWEKIREFIIQFANEKISKGLLANIFNEIKNGLENDYKDLKEGIKRSDIVGADETGEHIEGKKGWGWVFRTDFLTYYLIVKSRASKVVNSVIGKNFNGTLLTDFWGAYNEKLIHVLDFQKCLSHLDRDFEFVSEIENRKGISKIGIIREIFKDAIKVKKEIKFGSKKFKWKVKNIENKLNIALDETDFKTAAGNRLRKRLIKYRKHLLTFLYKENVPFNNNGSERDIRKFVGLRKICGSFRSKLNRGPKWQSVIMSVIETARKNDNNYFNFIYQRLNGNCDLKLLKI